MAFGIAQFCSKCLILYLIQVCICEVLGDKTTFKTSAINETIFLKETGEFCTCQPEGICSIPPSTAQGADIRIVTPPLGSECATGLVYCCFSVQQQYCGLRSSNLSSPPTLPGQSKFGEYPWQVLILNLENDYIGSGVILDATHVITAAHKVASCKKEDLMVRVGDWDVQSERELLKTLDVRVTAVSVHPDYDKRTLAHDVAVLSLSQRLQLFPTVPHINSICLPLPNTAFHGQRCWVSGWGKDLFGSLGSYQSVQKAVDVPVVEGSECQSQLRSTRLGRHFRLDQTSFLCAGGEPDKDACTGDGGSPLVCEGKDGRWQLAGLVAWGIGCAQPGVPGVYVNVASMVPWLLQHQQSSTTTSIHPD